MEKLGVSVSELTTLDQRVREAHNSLARFTDDFVRFNPEGYGVERMYTLVDYHIRGIKAQIQRVEREQARQQLCSVLNQIKAQTIIHEAMEIPTWLVHVYRWEGDWGYRDKVTVKFWMVRTFNEAENLRDVLVASGCMVEIEQGAVYEG